MATAPFPFFYSPPYTYPSAAAYPPPASGSFPAPAYGPYTFPSAATYPRPLSPGCYSNSAFPYFYSAPPAFPYAATYPYPPPAPAYTPASGFSPAHPSAPPIGAPAISVLPDHDSTSPAYHIPFNHPPVPAAPQLHLSQSHTSPIPHDSGSTTLRDGGVYQIKQSVPASHSSTPSSDYPFQQPPNATPTAPSRERRPPQSHSSSTRSDPIPSNSFMENDAEVLTATDERAQVKDAIRHRQHREFLNLQARLDKQLTRDRASLDKLHGELSKLSTLVSQFAVTMGMQMTEAPVVTESSPIVASAQFTSPTTTASMFSGMGAAASSPASSLSSPSGASATADVALQMFGEMPQSYGFHNLNSPSVFLADGTERSYFTLPTDYPLEQATPPMSHSAAESVGVAAPLSVAAQVGFLAPGLCSKANNTAGFESMLVHNLQVPTTMQHASSVFKEMYVYDIYEEDNSCLNCMDEQLAKPFHKAPENAFSEQLPKCFSKAPETNQTSACLYYITDVLDYALEQQQHDEKASSNIQQLREPQLNVLVTHERRKEWDPGDTERHVLFTPATGATKLQCTDVNKSAMVQILAVQLGARRVPIFESATMRSYAFGLGWTEVNGSALFVLAVPCSTCTFVAKQSMLLAHSDSSRTNHSFPKLVMHSLCTITVVQVTKQKHPLEFLLMTEMLHNVSAFRDGQLAYMPQGTSVGSEWCLSGYNASDNAVGEEATDFSFQHGPVIHDDRSIKLTNEKSTQAASILCVHEAIVHCHDERSEININKQNVLINNKHDITSCDMNNDKLVPFVLHYQFPRSRSIGILTRGEGGGLAAHVTPCTWDPGIESLLFSYKWMNITALIQIKGWTSMTYGGISSSEFPYTMDFLHDQWDFVHQPCVQKNYNAKNLLSSQNYLQIWEMDIIFITFLPP